MTDAIDRLLLGDASRDVIDEGFTARVMGALPARRAAPRAWLRPALVLGSAAVGSILAVALSPAAGSLLLGFQDLVQLRLSTPATSGLALSLALLASALILALEAD
jgi:hypothetical protein